MLKKMITVLSMLVSTLAFSLQNQQHMTFNSSSGH